MKNINVFICTTPFQISYCQLIIDNHFNKVSDYNFIYTSCDYEIKSKHVNEIVIANKASVWNQIINTWYALYRIRKFGKKGRLEFNFVHTSGLVANYCYEKYVKRKAKSFNLFYEGVLAFYKYEEKKHFRHFIRKAVGILYGIQYHYNKNIVPIENVQLNSFFTPFPENTRCLSEKIVEVAFPKKEIPGKENNLLILGGLIMSQKNSFEWEEIINKVWKLKNGKVFYKKHPDDKNNKLGTLFERLGIRGIEIDSSKIVEDLIVEYQIKTVCSLQISSALFNLRAIYGDQLNLYYGQTNMANNLSEVYKSAQKFKLMQL